MNVTLEVTITMTDEQAEQYQGRFGLIGLDPPEADEELRNDIATAVADALQHNCREGEFWSITVSRSDTASGETA